jgi:hypothetical protein
MLLYDVLWTDFIDGYRPPTSGSNFTVRNWSRELKLLGEVRVTSSCYDFAIFNIL